MRVLTAETFILRPDTVSDLAAFAADHPGHLLSVTTDPVGAAVLWRQRMRSHPFGGDGHVSLHLNGEALVPPESWDDVNATWHALIALVREFLEHGRGEQSIAHEAAPWLLRRDGRSTLLSTATGTRRVDPEQLLPALLDEARAFLDWLEQHVGLGAARARADLAEAERMLARG